VNLRSPWVVGKVPKPYLNKAHCCNIACNALTEKPKTIFFAMAMPEAMENEKWPHGYSSRKKFIDLRKIISK